MADTIYYDQIIVNCPGGGGGEPSCVTVTPIRHTGSGDDYVAEFIIQFERAISPGTPFTVTIQGVTSLALANKTLTGADLDGTFRWQGYTDPSGIPFIGSGESLVGYMGTFNDGSYTYVQCGDGYSE